jgi:hypothetical protein
VATIARHIWNWPGPPSERGELRIAGALDAPADQAQFLFAGATPEAAERFAREDPYVANGLVLDWSVRRWNTVVGDWAAQPVRLTS